MPVAEKPKKIPSNYPTCGDVARELQRASVSYGTKGQLNIRIPKSDEESHSQYRERTRNFAGVLIEWGKLDAKEVHSSRGYIVIDEPKKNLAAIIDGLDLPEDAKAFAKKRPQDLPKGEALVLAHVLENITKIDNPNLGEKGGFVRKVAKERMSEFLDPSIRLR